MQQWLSIIQGAALVLVAAQMINKVRRSGMTHPFGQKFARAIAQRRPIRSTGPVRRYLCLSVDVQEYGRNSDIRQAEIQHDLLALLDDAAKRAGLDRRRWIRQPKGDEELSLISDDQPSHRVVGDFCSALAAALWRYNNGQQPGGRMRLRLALDEGPVDRSANGFAGRAVVGVSRLVNAQPLRRALAMADQADLAVMLSDGVFRDWVRSGRSTVQAESMSRVEVNEKGYVVDAWLWLPRVTVPANPASAAMTVPADRYAQRPDGSTGMPNGHIWPIRTSDQGAVHIRR